MMASNLVSRFLPSSMAPSIYEDLRGHNGSPEPDDVESRAGMAVDEENLAPGFHDYELEQADVFDGNESQITTESTAFLTQPGRPRTRPRKEGWVPRDKSKSKWLSRS